MVDPTMYRELPRTEHGSAEWLEARLAGIGSSEVSALFGLVDWDSEWTIWLRKTRRAPADSGIDTEAMFWGRRLEPVIREVVCERLGVTVETPGTLQSIERPHMLYSPDGILRSKDGKPHPLDGALLETKNTAWFMASKWDGQIPDHAEIQIHHGMYVTGAKRAVAAGLVGGNRLVITEIERNERIINLAVPKCDEFWFNRVVADREPPIGGTGADQKAVRDLFPEGDGDIHVTREQIEPWHTELRAARKAEAEAKRRQRAADGHIRRLMAGGNRLLVGDDEWVRLKGGRLRTTDLAEEHPDLFEEYRTALAFNSPQFREDHPDIYDRFQSKSLNLKEVA